MEYIFQTPNIKSQTIKGDRKRKLHSFSEHGNLIYMLVFYVYGNAFCFENDYPSCNGMSRRKEKCVFHFVVPFFFIFLYFVVVVVVDVVVAIAVAVSVISAVSHSVQ